MEKILEEGGAISWPPTRNAACWCGSDTKYKLISTETDTATQVGPGQSGHQSSCRDR
jgi:hypothetical protein